MKNYTPTVPLQTIASATIIRNFIRGFIIGLLALPFLGVDFWFGLGAVVLALILCLVLSFRRVTGQSLGVWSEDPREHKRTLSSGRLVIGLVGEIKKERDDEATFLVTATIIVAHEKEKAYETLVRLRLTTEQAKLWQEGAIKHFRESSVYKGMLIHVADPDEWTKKDVKNQTARLKKISPKVHYQGILIRPDSKKSKRALRTFAILCVALGFFVGLLPASDRVNSMVANGYRLTKETLLGVSMLKQTWLEKALQKLKSEAPSGRIASVYVSRDSVRVSAQENQEWRDVEYRFDEVKDGGLSTEQQVEDTLVFSFDDLKAESIVSSIQKGSAALGVQESGKNDLYVQLNVEKIGDRSAELYAKTYTPTSTEIHWAKTNMQGEVIEESKN